MSKLQLIVALLIISAIALLALFFPRGQSGFLSPRVNAGPEILLEKDDQGNPSSAVQISKEVVKGLFKSSQEASQRLVTVEERLGVVEGLQARLSHGLDGNKDALERRSVPQRNDVGDVVKQKKTPKVVFGLFSSPLPEYAARLVGIAETWAKPLLSVWSSPKLLLVGVDGNISGVTYKPTPFCPDDHWIGAVCKEATTIATGYEMGADWVIVGNDDMYMFPKRWMEELDKHDPAWPVLLGNHNCGGGAFCEDHKNGMCGGASYAISRAAMERMVGEKEGASMAYIKACMKTGREVSGLWSDQTTSCMARRQGVNEVYLFGLHGDPIPDKSNLNMTAYREEMLKSNPRALTFHYIPIGAMHNIHKIAQEEHVL